MAGYGQFCPVALGAEVLTERWTPLVLRELIAGSRRFNDIRRGVPLMSPSLLSKRLKTLERAGLVERIELGEGRAVEYALTPAGRDAEPVLFAIGEWAMRWVRGRDLREEHLDARLLMWDMRRSIRGDTLPERRVVTRFHLAGSSHGKSRYWMVFDGGETDLCLVDPGFEVDLEVEVPVGVLVDVWMGNRSFAEVIATGELRLSGPPALVRQFPTWFLLSRFAGVAAVPGLA